jgi:hypothetical protein
VQLDKINDHHGLVVIQQENSPLSMKAIDLP